MVTKEMYNNLRKKGCVRKCKKVRGACLIYYKWKRSAESPGQGGGHCLGGTLLCTSQCQTGEYAVGLQGTRQRQVRQGGPVVALAKRSPKDLCVRGYTSHMVTDGKGEFAGSRGSFWDIFSTYHGGNQPLNALAVNSELTQHSWPASHEGQELAWTHRQYLGSRWTDSAFLAWHKQQWLGR